MITTMTAVSPVVIVVCSQVPQELFKGDFDKKINALNYELMLNTIY
jgi:hypothetical protein